MKVHLEKSTTTDRAIDLALLFLQTRDFKLLVDQFGTNCKSVSVKITHNSGRSSIGLGKGVDSQSLASALFESIEHYYYDYETLDSKSVINTDCAPLIEDMMPYLKDDILLTRRGSLFSCRSYTSVLSNNTLDFPIFFTNPHFSGTPSENDFINKLKLLRYSTNSGTASGVTTEEAILHGSLELIERDALGVLFINTIFRKVPIPPKIVDIDTVPESLKVMIDSLTIDNNVVFTIYDMTNDTNVPSYLAKLNDTKFEYSFFGSGSSLSAAYALERAVLEALQGYHIQFLQGRQIQNKRNPDEKYVSLFRRCCLDDGIYAPKLKPNVVRFTETEVSGDLKQQIAIISRFLSNIGASLYWRKILDDDLKVTQVISPELERFYLTSHGLPVMPLKRGKRLLEF